MSRVFLCVTVDTECDKGPGWRSRKPMTFRGIHEGVVNRLAPLFAAFGAKPTYLVSPEVLKDAAAAAALRALEGASELGAHLHGEYADPGAYEPDVTRAFQRDYPAAVERDKLTDLTDRFIAAFGHQPRSFRAGRFGIGPETLGILEGLGYTVDSSVTPHVDWRDVGAPGLAFPNAPTQPYHPDRREPGARGDATILEVPVTIRRRLRNFLPCVGARLSPLWLRPTRTPAGALVRLAEDEVLDARRAAPGRPVILNAMFHNVEIVPTLSPYAQTEAEARAILDRLSALLRFARDASASVVGLGDVPEILGS